MTQGQAIVLSSFEAQLVVDALDILNPDDDDADECRVKLIATFRQYIREDFTS